MKAFVKMVFDSYGSSIGLLIASIGTWAATSDAASENTAILGMIAAGTMLVFKLIGRSAE